MDIGLTFKMGLPFLKNNAKSFTLEADSVLRVGLALPRAVGTSKLIGPRGPELLSRSESQSCANVRKTAGEKDRVNMEA